MDASPIVAHRALSASSPRSWSRRSSAIWHQRRPLAEWYRVYVEVVRGHSVLRLRRCAATRRTNGIFPYDFPCPLTLSVASKVSEGQDSCYSTSRLTFSTTFSTKALYSASCSWVRASKRKTSTGCVFE